MKRRPLLLSVGALVAGACVGTESSAPGLSPSNAVASPTTSLSPSPTPRPSGTPPPPDWSALRTALKGTLLVPADAGYDQARILYNTRFDGARPMAVARCATDGDVRECVLFARRHTLPLAIRSGGHSYAGWSTGTGLVIDLRRMNAIDLGTGTVRIGAGTQLVDAYAAVAARGQGIAAGSCPTVGIAGLTLAGGLGVLSRAWGLTCDSVTGVDLVTADGTALTCDAQRNADLFWALRGGGGGNFGVVTALTLRTRPIERLALSFVRWDADRARDVMRAWQDWIATAPDDLWSNAHLDASPGSALGVAVHAVSVTDAATLGRAIDRLVGATGGAPAYREVGSLPYADAMLLEAGCLGRSAGQCRLHGDGDGVLERETYAATSVVAPRPLSAAAIDALITGLDALRSDPAQVAGAVIIDALGGAVGAVAPDATAFPHRSAFATLQILSSWYTAPGTIADASRAWLRRYGGDLRARIGTGAYVGYIDPDLANWESAYYGANYARLQKVKAAYDPDGVFTFPQAVRP